MRKLLAVLLATAMVFSTGVTSFAAVGDVTIKIFHTNDVHSRVSETTDKNGVLTNVGYPRLKSFIDAQKADGKIVVDAGDVMHGQAIATLERGNSIAQILKAVGYDILTPGNHDFNYGKNRLDTLILRAGIDGLAANVTEPGKGTYPFKRYVIKEISGVKIGIFGLSTPETAYKTNPKNVVGLKFGDKASIINTAQEVVDILNEKNCDVIVAVSHLGIDDTSDIKSTDIAENIKGIDVIIDGHSHSLLNNYKVGDTYIASTKEYMANIGEVTITVSKDGNVTVAPKVYSAAELQKYPEDTNVKALITGIQNRQKSTLNEVIGSSPILLDGERVNVRGGHTNLGNIITSAMIKETGAEIALTNGGGIRSSIQAGNITKGNALTVLPFGNYIVTKEVLGSDIIAALEHGMVFGEGSFPHFAGMTVEAQKVEAKKDDGTPYFRGKVLSVMIGDKPLEPTKTYTLATNDFMAVGGDGYKMFGTSKLLNEFPSLDEALIGYIASTSSEEIIKVGGESRLIYK